MAEQNLPGPVGLTLAPGAVATYRDATGKVGSFTGPATFWAPGNIVAVTPETTPPVTPPPPPVTPPSGTIVWPHAIKQGRIEVPGPAVGMPITFRLDVPADALKYIAVKVGEWGGGPTPQTGWMGTTPGAKDIRTPVPVSSLEFPLAVGHNGTPGWHIRVEKGKSYWFTVVPKEGFFIESRQFNG